MKKEKKPKVIKVVGNITYLESNCPEDKQKKHVSLETRKKLSEKRRQLTKQPREGQSKKAQNFYDQLEKDYITQTSARGRFESGKKIDDEAEANLNENEDFDIELELEKNNIVDEDNDTNATYDEDEKPDYKNFKFFIPITQEHKKLIKNWMNDNKEILKSISGKDGIINEYEIQKANFSQIKMTESLLVNIEQTRDFYDNESENLTQKLHEEFLSQERDETIMSTELNEYELFIYSEKERMYDVLDLQNISERVIDYMIRLYSKDLNKVWKIYQNIIEYDRTINPNKLLQDISDVFRMSFLLYFYDKDIEQISTYIAEKYPDLLKWINVNDITEIYG